MSLKQTLENLERAGFSLLRTKHSLQEAKVRVNPKTGTMWFRDSRDRLWSEDKREGHFDVLSRDGTYVRVTYYGQILGQKNSTLSYSH